MGLMALSPVAHSSHLLGDSLLASRSHSYSAPSLLLSGSPYKEAAYTQVLSMPYSRGIIVSCLPYLLTLHFLSLPELLL